MCVCESSWANVTAINSCESYGADAGMVRNLDCGSRFSRTLRRILKVTARYSDSCCKGLSGGRTEAYRTSGRGIASLLRRTAYEMAGADLSCPQASAKLFRSRARKSRYLIPSQETIMRRTKIFVAMLCAAMLWASGAFAQRSHRARSGAAEKTDLRPAEAREQRQSPSRSGWAHHQGPGYLQGLRVWSGSG